jgi:hypothetical protein
MVGTDATQVRQPPGVSRRVDVPVDKAIWRLLDMPTRTSLVVYARR